MVYTIKSYVDFDKMVDSAGSKLILIDFYASWCTPCKDMDPKIRSLSKKYTGKAIVLKVNVDKFIDIGEQYKVNAIPTFVFLKNKKRVSRCVGADEKKLETKMAELMKS